MSNKERRIYRIIKKGVLKSSKVFDIVNNVEKITSIAEHKGKMKIVPKKSEVKNIISFFYKTYKGEGARKLECRIKNHYTAISR